MQPMHDTDDKTKFDLGISIDNDAIFLCFGIVTNSTLDGIKTGLPFFLIESIFMCRTIGNALAEPFRTPKVGEVIVTTIEVIEEMFQITMVKAYIKCGDETIAQANMKIALMDIDSQD